MCYFLYLLLYNVYTFVFKLNKPKSNSMFFGPTVADPFAELVFIKTELLIR